MADVSKFLTRAEEAYNRRNYQYAVQMYLEALQVAPEHISARRMLRNVLLKSEESGTKLQSPKGQTVVLSGDPKVRLAEYEKSVVKDPRSAKYNKRVADSLVALGAHESAGYVYQYIISHCEKGKQNIDAMKAGAKAFIDAGKPQLAQQLLQRAYKYAPNDRDIADLQRNLAAGLSLSKISEATSSYDMVKNSDEAMELELLKKKVLSKEELVKAMKVVKRKLDIDPLDKAMIKKRAELYSRAKQFDKAYSFLMEKHEELDGAAPDLAELAVRYKNKEFEYNIKRYEKAAEEQPDKAEGYRTKADEFRTKREEFQLEEYERQVKDTPADLDKRYQYGKALFEFEKFQDAVEHLQRAAKSPKLGDEVGILLGRCFAEMGRNELAIKQLEGMKDQIPDANEDLIMEVRYWLADGYFRHGDKTRAKELFEELFMENAGFRDVGKRLDELNDN